MVNTKIVSGIIIGVIAIIVIGYFTMSDLPNQTIAEMEGLSDQIEIVESITIDNSTLNESPKNYVIELIDIPDIKE